jgi:hypothetical protein
VLVTMWKLILVMTLVNRVCCHLSCLSSMNCSTVPEQLAGVLADDASLPTMHVSGYGDRFSRDV